MSNGEGGPPDEVVRSIPIPTSDGDHDVVIENEPSGPGNELGGGEFPEAHPDPVAPEDVEHEDVEPDAIDTGGVADDDAVDPGES